MLRRFLFGVLAVYACTAGAQTPGSEDPAWQAPTLPQRPYGLTGWYDTDTQPNGQLVVAGKFEGIEYVWRYADNGSLDTSFGTNGAAPLPIIATQLTVDGLGRMYAWNTGPDQATRQIARLLPNGALDTSFGTGGVVSVEGPITRNMALTLLSDGRLLLSGYAFDQALILARKLLPDGRVDASFGTGGDLVLGNMAAVSIAATADGGFVIGYSENAGAAISGHVRKYTAGGTVDTSFGSSGMVSAAGIGVVEVRSRINGLLFLVLARANGDGTEYLLARLTPDGRLDTSFGNSGYVALGTSPYMLALEPEGGTVIARGGALTRLTPSGAVDGSFASPAVESFADLEIGNGIYGLVSRIEPNIMRSHVIRKFVVTPPSRSGSLSTGAASTSTFRVVTEDLRPILVNSTSTANAVGIHGYVYPQGSDLDASADLFVVVNTARGFFMRTGSGAFVAWNGQVATLVPAYEDVPLVNAVHVPVYSGQLPFADTYRIYIGYRRSEGGPLVYIETPGVLTVN